MIILTLKRFFEPVNTVLISRIKALLPLRRVESGHCHLSIGITIFTGIAGLNSLHRISGTPGRILKFWQLEKCYMKKPDYYVQRGGPGKYAIGIKKTWYY